MGTTIEKLNKVLETKEAIRTAINSKGGTLTESDTFSSYSTAIDNIQTGGGENPLQLYLDTRNTAQYLFSGVGYSEGGVTYSTNFTDITYEKLKELMSDVSFSNVINMSFMFSYCKKITTIPQLDTSSVNNMRKMFEACSSLITIPQLDTSSVIDMYAMFSGCSRLTSIPLLDTSKVANMSNMFNSCSRLTSISQLDTSKVTDMNYMFIRCSTLEKIDITTFTYNSDGFAGDCYSLKTLIIRTMNTIPRLYNGAFSNCYHFYGTTNATYNPEGLKDGAIYVPDDKVDALKVATNWSVFADIIKPLSEYVEE